jgi:glyoxylase-like metal-dependent hydrolase (beta-lactamase superfamily II)
MVNRAESLFPDRAAGAYAPAPMPPAIYTYTAAATGLFVNSYLVETDDGVVAIDAGLLVSDARAFRARLDALHQPLLAVLVTHGHPDHFNGVVELVRGQGDVPIYATPEGKAVIDEVAEPKRAQWSPTYGAQWPTETAYRNVS